MRPLVGSAAPQLQIQWDRRHGTGCMDVVVEYENWTSSPQR